MASEDMLVLPEVSLYVCTNLLDSKPVIECNVY
jgi:hypothetical protein